MRTGILFCCVLPLLIALSGDEQRVEAQLTPARGVPIVFAPVQLPPGHVGEFYWASLCSPAVGTAPGVLPAGSTPTPERPAGAGLCGGPGTNTLNPTLGQPPYYFTLAPMGGFLPFGLAIQQAGIVSGIPTAAGMRAFVACAVDQVGSQSCQTLHLTINPRREKQRDQRVENEPAARPKEAGASPTKETAAGAPSGGPGSSAGSGTETQAAGKKGRSGGTKAAGYVLGAAVGVVGAKLVANAITNGGGSSSSSSSSSSSGTCSSDSSCGSFGSRRACGAGAGANGALCGSDSLCHCCLTINDRCITCGPGGQVASCGGGGQCYRGICINLLGGPP